MNVEIRMQGGLPYVAVTLSYKGRQLELDQIVVDSGSAGTVFSSDEVAILGILPEGSDKLHRVRGVGGFEFVYSKTIEALALGTMNVENFEVQVGAMNYGFPLQGVIGVDFLRAARAVIDFGVLEVRPSSQASAQ